MNHHNITQVTERALRAFLITRLPDFADENGAPWLDDLRIYRGIENRDTAAEEGQESSIRQFPCVEIICESAEAVKPWRGNWDVKCTILVASVANDTTGDQHDTRAGQVFDAFLGSPSLPHAIEATFPQFWAGALDPDTQSHTTDEGRFVSQLEFTLKSACAAAMA